MVSVEWRGEPSHDGRVLDELFGKLAPVPLPPSQLDVVPDTLQVTGSFVEVAGRIEALEGLSDWIDRGIAAMRRGCPTSIGIVTEQLKRATTMSLVDTLRMEMTIATHCSENADFVEGVQSRATATATEGAPVLRSKTFMKARTSEKLGSFRGGGFHWGQPGGSGSGMASSGAVGSASG